MKAASMEAAFFSFNKNGQQLKTYFLKKNLVLLF